VPQPHDTPNINIHTTTTTTMPVVGKYVYEIRTGGKPVNHREKNGAWYADLVHKQQFSIYVKSSHSGRTKVTLTVNGKVMDRYLIDPHGTLDVSTNSDETSDEYQSTFVFLREQSAEAKEAGGSIGDAKNGLIELLIESEKDKPPARAVARGVSRKESCVREDCEDDADFGSGGLFGDSDAGPAAAAAPPSRFGQGDRSDRGGGERSEKSYRSGIVAFGDKGNQEWRKVQGLRDDEIGNRATVYIRLVEEVKPKYRAIVAPIPPRVDY